LRTGTRIHLIVIQVKGVAGERGGGSARFAQTYWASAVNGRHSNSLSGI